VRTDVCDPDSLRQLVDAATRDLGPVDLLVNNAGTEHYAYFEEIDLPVIENIIRTNLIGAEVLARLVLPGMVERRTGHIVNIASAAGKVPTPYNTVYASSKHALVGFSWSLRQEMKRYGVGVSVVCPIFVSERGLFHRWSGGRKTPSVAKPVSPDDVAAETVKAIERDRAEVVVSSRLGKIADVFAALSPDFTAGVSRRAGLYEFLESAVPYFRK
jgi:short-subunit dehydrogenase